MSSLPHAGNFRDLSVYQKARLLAQEIFETSKTFVDCGYLSQDQATVLNSKSEEIGRMLNGMMAKAYLFCNSPQSLREPESQYFINNDDVGRDK
jgi:hypothetical protein